MPARGRRSGMCIEASRYVNAINDERWRHMVLLRKGELWVSSEDNSGPIPLPAQNVRLTDLENEANVYLLNRAAEQYIAHGRINVVCFAREPLIGQRVKTRYRRIGVMLRHFIDLGIKIVQCRWTLFDRNLGSILFYSTTVVKSSRSSRRFRRQTAMSGVSMP